MNLSISQDQEYLLIQEKQESTEIFTPVYRIVYSHQSLISNKLDALTRGIEFRFEFYVEPSAQRIQGYIGEPCPENHASDDNYVVPPTSEGIMGPPYNESLCYRESHLLSMADVFQMVHLHNILSQDGSFLCLASAGDHAHDL